MSRLGRRVPSDDRHVRRYPLTAATMPVVPTPVVLGINWYSTFDDPEVVTAKGRRSYWIGRTPRRLGAWVGGHCVCLLPADTADLATWWTWYDQGQEGACVGFGCSRMMSLLNRRRYAARWLYRQAQDIDEWSDTPPEEGTSVRAGLDVLRTIGHRVLRADRMAPANLQDGILENRWATNVQQVLDALGTPNAAFVILLNSWGRRDYPHYTRMPVETLELLRREDGELGLVTDRVAVTA